MKSTHEWFTFENRCLICGRKFEGMNYESNQGPLIGGQTLHLFVHAREGILMRMEHGWVQLKKHPVGFPTPPYLIPK